MTDCVADVLELVGERWVLLVVREVALGLRRFDEILGATGMPRAVLSDRLQRLVRAEVLATRPYRVPGSRARTEYTLTEAGFDLLPVLSAFSDWSERHLAAGGSPEVVYRHAACGGRVRAAMVCECGERVEPHGRLLAEVNR